MDTILGVDWREAWKEHFAQKPTTGSSAYWDTRSKEFKQYGGTSNYAATFFDYLSIEPKQSVFDMGCGSGTLAVPLARDGHKVIAADFSAGMRAVALEKVQEEGLVDLEVKELDWEWDWEACGITPKSVDVAIASRSTIVPDLAEALMKLDRTARQKVAITMTTEFSPKGHRERNSVIEGSKPFVPDYVFGFNILLQMGAYPELRYIDTFYGERKDKEEKLVRWAYVSWKPVSSA